MPDNPRIEELRRRVQTDPASIAFAQLGEEYRRAGNFQEAITTCEAGLKIHPGYLSARVTLGRALIEVDDLDAAEVELRQVLQIAAENLAAMRGLAEIYHRRGQLPEALQFYKSALVLAKHDPDLEQTVDEISRAITPEPAPLEEDGMSFAEAQAEFLAALEGFEALGAAEHAEELAQAAEHPESPADAEVPGTSVAQGFSLLPEVPVTSVAQGFSPVQTELAEAAASAPVHPDLPDLAALESLDLTEPEEALEPAEALELVGAGVRAGAGVPAAAELHQLERFLDAIHTYRQRRAVGV